MKIILIAFFLLPVLVSRAQLSRSTGLIFDDDKYQRTNRLSLSLKWSESNLPFVSLKSYCPTPGNQGNIGSCVSWATGYAAMTISRAIQNGNTNRNDITNSARSALYIYNQIKLNNICNPGGSSLDDALQLVQTQGDCLLKDFNPNDCNAPINSSLRQLATESKIKDYYTLFQFNQSADQKIAATMNSLTANKPVIIGMNITSSIFNVGSDGEWNPNTDEPILGGHAVCVIGYNNNTKRFEILNSWGPSWGNGGYFTISYQDYARYCKYGYQITLENSHPEQPINLSGAFQFRKFTWIDAANNKFEFRNAPVQFDGSYYTLVDGVRLNDYFRISASNITKDQYVYIFSIKPDRTAEILFPQRKTIDGVTIKDLPIIPSNKVVLEIPVDPNKGLSTDQVGQDILCILYSSTLIPDIEFVIQTVKNSSGDFNTRLKQALGNRLVPQSAITYNQSTMGIAASTSGKSTIVPLVLKVNVQ